MSQPRDILACGLEVRKVAKDRRILRMETVVALKRCNSEDICGDDTEGPCGPVGKVPLREMRKTGASILILFLIFFSML